jgi:hypothetical protein
MSKEGTMKKGSTTGKGHADKKMGTSGAPSSSGNVGPGTQPGGR